MSSRQTTLNNLSADIQDYLDRDQDMHRQARLDALRDIFEKHFLPLQEELVVTPKDFEEVVSAAKSRMGNERIGFDDSRSFLANGDAAKLALFIAFTGFLNSKNALLRVPKFKETNNG